MINQKFHILYKTTNIITNNFYIGIHSTINLNDDYLGSGIRIRNEIQKYGPSNFRRDILQVFESRQAALSAESVIVNKELLLNPHCLNLCEGGMAGSGRQFTSEELKKAAIARKNKKRGLDCDLKLQIEMRERARSPISIEKRKKTFTKIGHQQGEKNSQYGLIWIFNDILIKSIRIKKEDLDSYIKDGWQIGRKQFSKRFEPFNKECKYCKSVFTIKYGHKSKQQYCSNSCSVKSRKD